jgi:hypothetical protein
MAELQRQGGLKGTDIANIVGVSAPTASSWANEKGTPPLETQTVLAELRYVVDRLSDFYNPDETRLWLHTRHPLLDHRRATELIREGQTKEVLAAIERMDAGAYL